MSRTTLCVLTAGVLAFSAVTMMAGRHYVLGDDVKMPVDEGTWKVTLVVNARSTGDARLLTATPLDFGHQHVLREAFKSNELQDRPPDARNPTRREAVWVQRPGAEGTLRAHYEFYCTTQMDQPTPAMTELAHTLAAAPGRGQYVQSEPGLESDDAEVTALARQLTGNLGKSSDQADALYRFVAHEIDNEPTVAGPAASARQCLEHMSGDSRAKSRLLAALLRNRGIPARLVTGLALGRGREQTSHVWVEAWVRDHWLPMCPFYHHYARVPRTFLVLAYGDTAVVRGRNVRNLDYGFLVEKIAARAEAAAPSLARDFFSFCSFHALPPAEQRLVEFLLLLPVAAIVVCLCRNVIGVNSFGTFAPALLGLSFRELHSLPGIFVFISIVLAGWVLRRWLDRYHLLQVPRMAVLLSLVVFMLISCIVLAAHRNIPATRYVSLFPIVILVGMIERFWTLETEDGTVSSFRTLLTTMLIAVAVAVVTSLHAIAVQLFRYPETLGLLMAVQLLLGRYTGYRLLELYRFRDFMNGPEDELALQTAGGAVIAGTVKPFSATERRLGA